MKDQYKTSYEVMLCLVNILVHKILLLYFENIVSHWIVLISFNVIALLSLLIVNLI